MFTSTSNVKIEPVFGVLLPEDRIKTDQLPGGVKRVGVAEGVDLEAAISLLTQHAHAFSETEGEVEGFLGVHTLRYTAWLVVWWCGG